MGEDMKKLGWYKTYQPFQFHYDKMIIEDFYPREMSDDDCYDDLEKRLDRQAMRKYPSLNVVPDKPFVSALASSMKNIGNPYPEPDTRTVLTLTPKADTTHSEPEQKPLLQLIQESKTVGELKGWRLLLKVAENKDELQEAYDRKMDALTKVIGV